MIEEVENATSVGNNRAHSDGRSEENECGSSQRVGVRNGAS